MKKVWPVAVLAILAAGASAQETENAGTAKVVFEKKASYPFEGEINASRLNVRMFPKADADSIIASVLSKGAKVTVVGERESFYQILAPRGCTAWIYGRNVRKDGAGGTVMANDVPVRLDSRVTAQPLCTLKRGTEVKVVGEHMGWYKISAPEEVKYYVAKKYVHQIRALPVLAKDGVKAPGKAAGPTASSKHRPHLDVADALLAEQKELIEARRLEEVDFTNVVAALDLAKGEAKTDSARQEVEAMLSRYSKLHIAWQDFKIAMLEEQRRVAVTLAEKAKEKPAPKTWAMTGFVDTTGLLWKRPGTHKLVMGGKIVCFLRIKDGDKKMIGNLNGHFRKYVGVNGTVIKNPDGWDGYSVVVVEEIEAIERK